MHYEKLDNGNLLISATTKDEQKVLDLIIAAIEAYKETWAHFPEPEPEED
jgi:hypothetical protein